MIWCRARRASFSNLPYSALQLRTQGAIRNGVVILGLDAESAIKLEALEEFHPKTQRKVRQAIDVDVCVGDLRMRVPSFIKA